MSWVVELRSGSLITTVGKTINMLWDIVVSLDKCEKWSEKLLLNIILDQHISSFLLKIIAKMQAGNTWWSRFFFCKESGILVDLRPNTSHKFHTLTKNHKSFAGVCEKNQNLQKNDFLVCWALLKLILNTESVWAFSFETDSNRLKMRQAKCTE